MSLNEHKIVQIEDPNEWNTLFDKFEDGNLYQTWNYAAVVQNEKQIHHVAVHKNYEVIGLAQIRLKTIPLLNRGVGYIFSGPLWRRKEQQNSIDNFSNILKSLKTEYVDNKKLVLRIRPYLFSDEEISNAADIIFFRTHQFKKLETEYNSLVLNLNEDREVIKKNLRPRWRNYLNQATRNDLEVLEGSDKDIFRTFINLYDQMQERKNFREYVDPVKIGLMNELLNNEYKLKVFIAYKNKEPIAGLVGTAIGKTGIYLLGATNERGLEFRASYLLHWEMINWMKSVKCERYDLGGANKERNPGGYKFKTGISSAEISDVGTFECSTNYLSKLFLTLGEKLRKN